MIKLKNAEGLNVIPFIDIVLVLLAMVLSISTFIAHGEIQLELPKTESNAPSSNQDVAIEISINAENVFFINGKQASIKDIKHQLDSISETTSIELKSDKNAKFESFIQIVDILRKNNHKNFQIITERTQ